MGMNNDFEIEPEARLISGWFRREPEVAAGRAKCGRVDDVGRMNVLDREG